jgi:hypothetical protein
LGEAARLTKTDRRNKGGLMTVAELIKNLQDYPPDTIVKVYNDMSGDGWDAITNIDGRKDGELLIG